MNIGLLYIMATGLTSSISIKSINNAINVEYDEEEIAKVVFSLDDACNASERQDRFSIQDYENFFVWNKSNKEIKSKVKNESVYNENIFTLTLDKKIDKNKIIHCKRFQFKKFKINVIGS